MATSRTDHSSDGSARPLKRPWLGTLLSLLVPGLGLIRAQRIRRGSAWFVALHAFAFSVTLLFIWRAVPTAVVGCAWLGWGIAYLVMLVDSWRPGRLGRGSWLLVPVALAASVALVSSRRLIAHAFKVPTGAMQPTLNGVSGSAAADHIIADRLSYRFASPRRGDLVVFRTDGIYGIAPPAAFYIKRVVGLPGERIVIRDGRVFADGRELGPADGIPATIDYFNHIKTNEPGFAVPEGSYFALGDNSRYSYDSRYWGAVPHANIFGRVARIYYPFSRASVPK